MRTGVDRFKFIHKNESKNGKYACLYQNIIYGIGSFLGEGSYGKVYQLVSSDSAALDLVIKVEIATLKYLKYDDGHSVEMKAYWNENDFLNEAFFSKKLLGLGAFAGKENDTSSAHYVLLPFLSGVDLVNLSISSLTDFLLISHALANAVWDYHLSHGVVHGDICNRNIKIHGNSAIGYSVTLFDFTLTRFVGEDTMGLNNNAYHPAELLKGIPAKTDQDIFCFGKLLHEYNYFSEHSAPNSLMKRIKALITNCTNDDPTKRISITAVKRELQEMIVIHSASNSLTKITAQPESKELSAMTQAFGLFKVSNLPTNHVDEAEVKKDAVTKVIS